ncbi:MAG: DUF6356 family protein [Pseudomonadota bacterium]
MKPFTEHPHSVGETYFEHMRASFRFGLRMLMASLGCFVHGLFPFLCTSTGSSTITVLHRKMVTHRRKDAMDAPVASRVNMPATRQV